MGDETHPLTELARDGERVNARLTRRLDHPAQLVWRMLTATAQLPSWLGPGVIELRVGGRTRLDFAGSGTVIDSLVTALEPGRLVEYSWSQPGEPSRPVRWRVEPEGAGTRLVLEVGTPAGEDAARACAGWEAHLQMLEAALAGAPIGFPFETFKAAREAYRGKVAALS
jgi:uncharacterized protein YndB with AHSA1/START domain